jgi:hypothetical protein
MKRLRIRLRAWRYSRARQRVLDAELITWAEGLIGRRRRPDATH